MRTHKGVHQPPHTCETDEAKLARAASKSLRPIRNLRDPGVEPEALTRRRRRRLAEPGLKTTARWTRSVRDRARLGTDLIDEVCQTGGRRVESRNVTLGVAILQLRGRTGPGSGTRRRRSRQDPTRSQRLGWKRRNRETGSRWPEKRQKRYLEPLRAAQRTRSLTAQQTEP